MLNSHFHSQDTHGFRQVDRLVLAGNDQALLANPPLQTRRPRSCGKNQRVHLVAIKNAIGAWIKAAGCRNKDYLFALAAKLGPQVAQ